MPLSRIISRVPVDKAKKRVGTHSGDGQIRELQLCPGIVTGLKRRISLNDIAWGGSHVLRQERNDIDCLFHFGLFERLRP